VHIEELTMPEGVTAVSEAGQALVAVVPPTVEEAPVAAEPAEGTVPAPAPADVAAKETAS
jgi:hypothetical protein